MINQNLKKVVLALRESSVTEAYIQCILKEIDKERVLVKDAVFTCIATKIAVPHTREFMNEFEKI